MSVHELVFSEKMTVRIGRHLLFWAVFSLHVFFFRFYVYDLNYLFYKSTYTTRLQNLLLFLPESVFYAYCSIYLLLPRYLLKRQYARLLGIIFLLTIMLVVFSYRMSIWFNIKLAWDMPATRADIVRHIDFTFNNGIVYPLAVSAFAIAIKMSKKFYLQQKQNTVLSIQKINSGVQMLKSQVHARFLFHSLKTIHDDLLSGGQKSPEMLLRLSELLSYILYESDKMMPLEKELLLLNNYIGLEKINWGDRLIINNTKCLVTEGQLIEPLLLLPLAEYIFDNIDKQQHDQVFLHLDMHSEKNNFHFQIRVSGLSAKPVNGFDIDVHLLQVQKRLHAQYASKHQLAIANTQDGVSVTLLLETNRSFH